MYTYLSSSMSNITVLILFTILQQLEEIDRFIFNILNIMNIKLKQKESFF